MSVINFRGQKITYTSRNEFFQKVEAEKWEKETFDVLDKYIVPGKVFIDIGAWVGVLSIYAALKGAKVYSVEPDPVAFRELFANVEANQLLKQISMQMVAICDHCGFAQLNSMTATGFGNSESSLVNRGVVEQSETVHTYTLASYLQVFYYSGDYVAKPQPSAECINALQQICLIKIDIEGGEVLLLQGSEDFLKECAPPMYISFHPAWFPNKEKDIQTIADIIFPIYIVTSAATGNVLQVTDFEKALLVDHDHSFILTKSNPL